MFGDPRDLVLHYFLADDTIELLEDVPLNSGREALPLFLNRCRLSKGTIALPQPGVLTKRTVLNVFGPMGHGGRVTLDSLRVGAVCVHVCVCVCVCVCVRCDCARNRLGQWPPRAIMRATWPLELC